MKKKLQFKIENGILYSQEVPKCEKVLVGSCYYCGEPMYASPGEAIRYMRPKVTVLNADEERKEYPVHKKCYRLNKKNKKT